MVEPAPPPISVRARQPDSESSDSEREEGCGGSPRVQRRRRWHQLQRGGARGVGRGGQPRGDIDDHDDLTYMDTLPEVRAVI